MKRVIIEHTARVKELAGSKVGYFDPEVIIEKQVLGLEVTIDRRQQ